MKDPLELFVKRREFLPGPRFLSRRDMTYAKKLLKNRYPSIKNHWQEGGGGGGGGGGFLYFTNLAGNLVLTSPHVGILHNFIICYHSACDFCLL